MESPEGVIRYQYDANGNRSLLSTAHQHVQYGFDELNRLASVTNRPGRQTSYQYNRRNQKTRVSLPNGTSSYWEYDDNGRLLEVRHERTATGEILGAYRYTLAPNGQRNRLTERDNDGPTRTADYDYDGLNRLTGKPSPITATPAGATPAAGSTARSATASARPGRRTGRKKSPSTPTTPMTLSDRI